MYSSVSPYSTLYMTVRVVGGGGVRSCVLRIVGPGSGSRLVSSPLAIVRGGSFTGGGGLLSAGGNSTRRWAIAALGQSTINAMSNARSRAGSVTNGCHGLVRQAVVGSTISGRVRLSRLPQV